MGCAHSFPNTMGCAHSSKEYHKLYMILPWCPYYPYVGHSDQARNQARVLKGEGYFADFDDKNSFTDAVMLIFSSNGENRMRGYTFQMQYTRQPDKEKGWICHIVAMKDGVVRAKIESTVGRTTCKEAFQQLRLDVEHKFSRLLTKVPSQVPAEESEGARTDAAPPAYEQGDMDQKVTQMP